MKNIKKLLVLLVCAIFVIAEPAQTALAATYSTTYANRYYTGLKQYNRVWYYYTNGSINKNYTGLCKYNGVWYYVSNGRLNWGYSGLCKYNGTWYYISKGRLDWNYIGLCKYNGTWYYVSKGRLNWNFTGLCKYNGTWYYISKGRLDWNFTGLCKFNGIWYYVNGGRFIPSYTGLCRFNGIWYYVNNGRFNSGYNGLCKYNGIWYYISNSRLNWGYTGLCKYNGIWYYIKDGRLDWSYNGLCKYSNGYLYYISGGRIDWNFTGIADMDYISYYVSKGRVDTTYNGWYTYKDTDYYIENGIVVPHVVQNEGFKNVVVFVQFNKDENYNFVTGKENEIYDYWDNPTNGKSLSSYLNTISYGQFKVDNIFPQYENKNRIYKAYTIETPTDDYQLLKRVIDEIQLDPSLDYDYDDDGCIDNLTIVVDVDNPDDRDSIFHPHKAVYPGDDTLNGLLIRNYNVINRASFKSDDPYKGSLGTYGYICHEFMHSIGYPDLYKYDLSDNDPVGAWDLMASATTFLQYPLAYLRSAVSGWIDIDTITTDQTQLTLSVPSDKDGNHAYILKSPLSDTELFVVEYRQKGTDIYGLEYKLPGSGLIVYRIDTTVENLSNAYSGNGIYVFREGVSDDANCGRDLSTSFLSQESGRTSFGSTDLSKNMSDNALVYSDGSNSGIVIKNVGSSSGDTITFDVEFADLSGIDYWNSLGTGNMSESECTNIDILSNNGQLSVITVQDGNGLLLSDMLNNRWNSKLISAGDIYISKSVVWNGSTYVLYNDRSWNLKLARYDGNSYKDIGVIASSDVTRFTTYSDMYASSDGLYIAYDYYDSVDTVSLKKYDGTSISYVASKFYSGNISSISVSEYCGSRYVAFRDYSDPDNFYKLRVFSIDGNGKVTDLNCAELGEAIVIRGDSTGLYIMTVRSGMESSVKVYKYNGKIFDQIGWDIISDSSLEYDIEISNGQIYVAIADQTIDKTFVMHYDASLKKWDKIGADIASRSVDDLDLMINDGKLYLAYINNGSPIVKWYYTTKK